MEGEDSRQSAIQAGLLPGNNREEEGRGKGTVTHKRGHTAAAPYDFNLWQLTSLEFIIYSGTRHTHFSNAISHPSFSLLLSHHTCFISLYLSRPLHRITAILPLPPPPSLNLHIEVSINKRS